MMIGPKLDGAIRQAHNEHSTIGQANSSNWLGAIGNHLKPRELQNQRIKSMKSHTKRHNSLEDIFSEVFLNVRFAIK